MFNNIHGKDDLLRKLDRLAWDRIEMRPYEEPSPASRHSFLGMSLGLTYYGITYQVGYKGWFGRCRSKAYTERLGVGSFYSDGKTISLEVLDVMGDRFDTLHSRGTQHIKLYNAAGSLLVASTS